MAEILGLTLSHFPFQRFKHYHMPGVLRGNVARAWADKPHLQDPQNWAAVMREEWGDDQGETAGKLGQARQIEQFRKVRTALDDFRPDLMVMVYRDFGEAWRESPRPEWPQYWIHIQDEVQLKLFQLFGNRENYFEEDPDRIDTIQIHREAATYLEKGLRDRGLSPSIQTESGAALGLGHNALAGIVHTDWDRREFKTPIVPVAIDPFGFLRERGAGGLGPWDRMAPPPLTPQEAFSLGRAIAQTYRESPWRVALVAPTNWSNAGNTFASNDRLHPDREADEARYAQWKNNQFSNWGGDWTFDEMEEHAQWECLLSIIMAGAMTETGAKVVHSDLQTTWVLNSDWLTTVFEVK